MQKIDETVYEDRRMKTNEMSAIFPYIFRSLLHETSTETLGHQKIVFKMGPKITGRATQIESGC